MATAKNKKSTKQVKSSGVKKHNPNPTGKGGFQDHPELRNDGRWDYRDSYSYWLSKLERMTLKEVHAFKKTYPESKRTVAMDLAFRHTKSARSDINFAKERSDRTVGKAKQSIDHTTKDESLNQYSALTTEQLRKLAG